MGDGMTEYVKVDIHSDFVDDIVIASLREAYKLNLHPTKIDHAEEYIEPDFEFLDAVDLVLRYYQNHQKQQEWEKIKVVL